MSEFLANPAVQGGVAPFVVALIAVLLLQPLRLGGFAVSAGFLTAMFLVSGLQFIPLTATRKIVLLSVAAPVAGMLADFAFKPTRLGAALLAIGASIATLWVFGPVVLQKQAWLAGAAIALATVFIVGFSQSFLAGDAVRAGANGLALGLGSGVAAYLGASLTYGLYGVAIGAASGAFLLPQMIMSKRTAAGATFTLPAALLASLVAAGAIVLAELPWYCIAVLALVPVAARLPAPAKAPVWLQAVLISLYAFAVAAAACALAWRASRT